MITPHSPLAAWCDRNPRVRWPLLLILIFVLWGLAGGLDDPTEYL